MSWFKNGIVNWQGRFWKDYRFLTSLSSRYTNTTSSPWHCNRRRAERMEASGRYWSARLELDWCVSGQPNSGAKVFSSFPGATQAFPPFSYIFPHLPLLVSGPPRIPLSLVFRTLYSRPRINSFYRTERIFVRTRCINWNIFWNSLLRIRWWKGKKKEKSTEG